MRTVQTQNELEREQFYSFRLLHFVTLFLITGLITFLLVTGFQMKPSTNLVFIYDVTKTRN